MPHMRILSAVLGLMAANAVSIGSACAAHRDEKIYESASVNYDGAIDLLERIVDIDSGTGDVDGGKRLHELLTARLTALGAEVSHEPAESADLPDCLVAVFNGTGKARILLIAHIDTVFAPGTAAARPFRRDAYHAYGPGVGDEKAGVVNAIMALKILHDVKFSNYAAITLLLDNSEERGSPGSTNLIKKLARSNDVELNMEPGDPPDAVTVWRKGSSTLRVRVSGRAAHAGMAPQDGRNAASELVHQIAAIDGTFPHTGEATTVNLTVINAGERRNIIPDAAEALFSVRYRKPEDFAAVLDQVRQMSHDVVIPDTHVTVDLDGSSFPPLIENAAIDALAGRARSIYAELGKSLATSGNGGASESALAMGEGTPTLDGLGYVGGDFHTDHEWIELASIKPRLYLLTRLLIDLGKDPIRRP